MIQAKIMHTCTQTLLNVSGMVGEEVRTDEHGNPVLVPLPGPVDPENIESLCQLLQTIGLRLEEHAAGDGSGIRSRLIQLYFDSETLVHDLMSLTLLSQDSPTFAETHRFLRASVS